MSIRPGSPLPVPVTTLPAVALAGDFTPQHVARRVREGAWVRTGRGVYVPTTTMAAPRRAALARIVATHHRLGAPHVFSHGSAAVLWGLTLWSIPPTTHVYQSRHPGTRRDPSIRRHTGRLPAGEVVTVCGLPVTSLERTVVDCARTLPPRAALVVADSGLRAGASPERLAEILGAGTTAPGMARARHIVELADGGSESPWETATRFVMLRAGLPRPATQIPVATRLGTFWADLGWEEWHLLLEYDGRSKYADPEEIVREKRRHDAVVETGARLLHATKEDVRSSTALTMRVFAALPGDTPRIRRPYLRDH